jgi:hypothetical protein
VNKTLGAFQLALVPLGDGSCSMQNQTSICCFDPGRAFGEPSWLSLNQQDAEFSFGHQAVLESSRGYV